MQTTIHDNRFRALPLHVPKARVAEASYMTTAKCLHNASTIHLIQDPAESLWSCRTLMSRCPTLPTSQGHLVCPADVLPDLSARERGIMSFSSKSAVHQEPDLYSQYLHQEIRRWLTHYHVSWKFEKESNADRIRDQAKQHKLAMKQTRGINLQEIMRIKALQTFSFPERRP